jgi:hypothetical protein
MQGKTRNDLTNLLILLDNNPPIPSDLANPRDDIMEVPHAPGTSGDNHIGFVGDVAVGDGFGFVGL